MSDRSRAYGLDLLSRRELESSADGEIDNSETLPSFDADDARREWASVPKAEPRWVE